MTQPILYLGDTDRQSAAAYLCGLLDHWGWAFDYVPSHQAVPDRLLDEPRKLFVLSDYPAARMPGHVQEKLVGQVDGGAGLVMLGGWESFHGAGGDWDGTPVGEALPVRIDSRDDRLNCDQPMLVRRVADHPTVRDLPWDERPPAIGGLNRLQPARGATTVLEAQRFHVFNRDGQFVFEPADCHPLLVVGHRGQGRTAALATDVAPHWVGGLVDWGSQRVTAQAPGAEAVEVGELYARFFRQFLSWTGRLDS